MLYALSHLGGTLWRSRATALSDLVRPWKLKEARCRSMTGTDSSPYLRIADTTRRLTGVTSYPQDGVTAQEHSYGDSGDAAAQGCWLGPRPYIGMLFECCGVYTRIYRRPGQMVYVGRCPKCMRSVRVRVRRDGINARLFRAT